MWTYAISSGRLYRNLNLASSICYSGKGQYKNRPSSTSLHNLGPIPVGLYTMGKAKNSDDHGPLAIPLDPDPSNEMFGRTSFLIHGDSTEHPGEASEGCIIAPRWIRQEIDLQADKQLRVVQGDEDVRDI